MTISTAIGTAPARTPREPARNEILSRLRCFAKFAAKSRSRSTDLFTISDRRSEARIYECILDAISDDAVIDVEAAADEPSLLNRIADGEAAVFGDPLDGTWNFVKGLPLFGSKPSVAELGQSMFGVPCELPMDDSISAHLSRCSEFLAADGRMTLAQTGKQVAIYCMAGLFPPFLFTDAERRKLAWKFRVFDRALSHGHSIREFRLPAECDVDFFPTGRLTLWDNAAGKFVYREAGGRSAILAEGSENRPAFS